MFSELIAHHFGFGFISAISSEDSPKLCDCLLCPRVASSLDFLGVLHDVLNPKLIDEEKRKELLWLVLDHDLLDRILFPRYGIYAIIYRTKPSGFVDCGEDELEDIPLYGALFHVLIAPEVLPEKERNQLLSEVIFSDEWKAIRRDPENVPVDYELLKKCLEKALSLKPNKQFYRTKEVAQFINLTNPLVMDTPNPDTVSLIEAIQVPNKGFFL